MVLRLFALMSFMLILSTVISIPERELCFGDFVLKTLKKIQERERDRKKEFGKVCFHLGIYSLISFKLVMIIDTTKLYTLKPD